MKKHLQFTVTILTFGIYILGMFLCIKISENNEETVATNSTAITSHVVVIDAGHGKPDEGAIGLYGTNEEALNLEIALKLQALIEQSGGVVYLTRSDENGIYSSDATTIHEKKVSDTKNRVQIGNSEDVDIFVSIHLNKYVSSQYSGWQTFYQEENDNSKYLAQCIQESLNDVIPVENNRAVHTISGVYIMDHIDNPTVIVECGFLSNEEEAKKLEDDEYQELLAWGIYIGIQNYFSK